MALAGHSISPNKKILWGLLAIFLQLVWLVLSHPRVFPYFDVCLMLCTLLFMANDRPFVDVVCNPARLKTRDFIFVLVIVSLAAILTGLEKFFAAFLIWTIAVVLQAKVVEFFYLIGARLASFNSRQCILAAATQLIVLFFLFGDTDYYKNSPLQYGTLSTAPYFHLFSIGWMAFFFFIPSALLFACLNRQQMSSSPFWQQLQNKGGHAFTRQFYMLLILLFAIMLLLCVEMQRPHFGQLIMLGDESGYAMYARDIAAFKHYMPSQPPLYTGTLGVLMTLFGDRPEIGLVLNFILLIGSFVLLVYACLALTKNLFFSVLAAMLFVSNRGTYLFVWTPLTETMNTFVLITSMAAALYLIQKKNLAAYVCFGIATVSNVLLRSQNGLFTIILIGLTFWYLYQEPESRPRIRQLAVFLALFILPQLLWAAYRCHFTSHFQLADGRSVPMFYGFNAPGTIQGLDVTNWAKAVDDWTLKNPKKSQNAMLWAAIKLRLENPSETLSFWYWRAVELFNFRFIGQYGVKPTLAMNAQLIMLYGLFVFTLFKQFSRVHVVTLLLWSGFYISFVLVYSESRYRYPGDVILYLAVVRCLYEIFALKRERLDAPIPALYAFRFPQQPFYTFSYISLGILLLLALPNLSGIDRQFPGTVPARKQLARSEEFYVAGVTPVSLKELTNVQPEKLAGKMVTIPLTFDGFRFRVGSLSAAVSEGIPEDTFNYASFDGFEITVKKQGEMPNELKVKKIALDTQSIYWGADIKISEPYIATVLLLGKPVVNGPEGGTLMGRLLTLEPDPPRINHG